MLSFRNPAAGLSTNVIPRSDGAAGLVNTTLSFAGNTLSQTGDLPIYSINCDSATNYHRATIDTNRSRAGSAVQSGDWLNSMVAYGVAPDLQKYILTEIRSMVTGTPSGSLVPSSILFATNNVERMRLSEGGELLINRTASSGNGRLQFATSTSTAGGIAFSDVTIYRSGSAALRTNGSLTVDGTISVAGNQVVGARITGYGSTTGATRAVNCAPGNTLSELQGILAAVIADLKTHGLIA